MSTRMDKYNNQNENIINKENYGSRSRKNEELYQTMALNDIDNVNLSSNAHIIGENDKNINIDKVKEILEKKYSEQPRKSHTFIREEKNDSVIEEQETTKEYNINSIIEKAKKEKEIDYEKDRLKKVRDTQYDILKGLSLEEEKSKVTSDKEKLVDLIETINEQEMTRELNPLDILTDLKGDDNTVVLDGIEEEVTKREKEIIPAISKEQIKEEKPKNEVKKEIDKTFFTNSVSFSKSDFDDFNDLKENVETNKLLIKVLVIIITIAFIAGILFLANQIFHLNWF